LIRDTYKVQTQVLIYDFTKLCNETAVAELNEMLASIKGEISIVVNNVGTCKFKEFEQ